MWGGNLTFAQMEKKSGLNYLRSITLILLVVYMLFTLMNFLKGVWNFAFHFNYGELGPPIKFQNYAGKFHLVVYVSVYLLEIVFMLILNRFVRKNGIGKGYHVLIVLLSFLPLANCFLFFMLKRKLNKQLFDYSGISGKMSDRKLIAAWVLIIIFVLSSLIAPLLIMYLSSPEAVSEVSHNWGRFSLLITDSYFLSTSLIYLFYYLEFKKMLHKLDLMRNDISDNQLLDDRVVIADL